MKAVDPIVCLELHIIRKIIDDETWLEGERRGHAVSPEDPVVVTAVCAVILRIGAELRVSMQHVLEEQGQASDEARPMAA